MIEIPKTNVREQQENELASPSCMRVTKEIVAKLNNKQ